VPRAILLGVASAGWLGAPSSSYVFVYSVPSL